MHPVESRKNSGKIVDIRSDGSRAPSNGYLDFPNEINALPLAQANSTDGKPKWQLDDKVDESQREMLNAADKEIAASVYEQNKKKKKNVAGTDKSHSAKAKKHDLKHDTSSGPVI